MALVKIFSTKYALSTLLLLHLLPNIQPARLAELLTIDPESDLDSSRTPREAQYRLDRHLAPTTSQTVSSSRPIKNEDPSDARDRDSLDRASLEKRCARCEAYYYGRDRNPNPYDSRSGYDDRYDDRYRDRDRYYDDRYRDRYYDDYDRRYYDSDRRYYDYDRDRYERRPDPYERYDRYDRYDRNPVKSDRDRYDKNDVNRYYDRYDRVGYRPWDETTRGSSGFDNNGRGYYFSVGRPEYSSYGSGYASNWNYSRDDDKDRGWREQGFGGSASSYRPRDPYDPGYRGGTSYLYGRPSSSTTTELPNSAGGNADTDHPQSQDSPSSGRMS